jgi:hypothetical protein
VGAPYGDEVPPRAALRRGGDGRRGQGGLIGVARRAQPAAPPDDLGRVDPLLVPGRQYR